MIPIIEDSISAVISDSFSYLKENPDKINSILYMQESKRKDLITYLTNNPIKIKRGYPRTNVELPCICILLSGEGESQEGIGDYAQNLSVSVDTNREDLLVQYDPINKSFFIKLSQFPLKTIDNVYNLMTDETYSNGELNLQDSTRGIIWLPDSVETNDIIRVEYTYSTCATDGVYTQFESNFRIEVWTTNADLTVQLYYLVKWALLVGRDRLHLEIGLYNQKLGGSDFQPAPNFFPDFVYRRALTFWCQLTEAVPSQEISYISKIEVNKTIDFDTEIGGGENNG